MSLDIERKKGVFCHKKAALNFRMVKAINAINYKIADACLA